MNISQTTVILIGIVIVIFMIMVPPWTMEYRPRFDWTGVQTNHYGYHYIAGELPDPRPMELDGERRGRLIQYSLTINSTLLAIQEAIALFIVIGLVLVLKDD